MYYLRSYLLEDETARNKRNGKADAPVIGDQSGRMVDRKEFPQFVMGFRDALRLRRTAWQKARLRKGGEVGGNQTQAAKAAKQKEAKRRDAEEVTVPALTSRDSGRLSEADSRRSRKK